MFSKYKKEGSKYITLLDSPYYPVYLQEAVKIFEDIEKKFRQLVNEAEDSASLLRLIHKEPGVIRNKLLSYFCRYVSPNTKTELLKKKGNLEKNIRDFKGEFTHIDTLRERLSTRPNPDEVMAALLFQYINRGEKGYLLTKQFFNWFRNKFSDNFKIIGPEGPGRDIDISKVLEDFKEKMPADFVIFDKPNDNPVAIGFARYDTDRGGSQEDDRTSGNRDKIPSILKYNKDKNLNIKIIFVNDGPGLLLGSMWDDYSKIEKESPQVLVTTLKMLDERLTEDWLVS